MTITPKDVYIDMLHEVVDKCSNISNRTIKMKPVSVLTSMLSIMTKMLR